MLKYVFIRHGATAGNKKNRYIGSTDEGITEEGARQLKMSAMGGIYGNPDLVFVSPMKRCLQTAGILYPEKTLRIVNDFRECDFGEFENKNYVELKDNPLYQQWVESNGSMTFPKGENPFRFRERCCAAFSKTVEDIQNQLRIAEVSFVIHGGTIMSIFERFEESGKEFYDWNINNGSGYQAEHLDGVKFQILKMIDGGKL